MSTTADGHTAERAVLEYLQSNHHQVLAQNWRTPRCEIDIISTHNKAVYFTEVKYRRSTQYGDGLDYITTAKQRQMQFAAQLWLAQQSVQFEEQILLAAAVTGSDYTITALVELS